VWRVSVVMGEGEGCVWEGGRRRGFCATDLALNRRRSQHHHTHALTPPPQPSPPTNRPQDVFIGDFLSDLRALQGAYNEAKGGAGAATAAGTREAVWRVLRGWNDRQVRFVIIQGVSAALPSLLSAHVV
jgi:hypothetical protein